MRMTTLHRLAELGQSPWLDFISRRAIHNGEMQALRDQGILGVTSNPAIFEAAIAGSSDYDEAIKDLAGKGLDAYGIYDQLSIEDVAAAADLFRPVFEKTHGIDGYVSLEVSPFLADNTEESISEGRRLWKALNRPNVMIKVPATEAGIPVIEALIAAGINVNVTLLFSLERYEAAAKAYLAGLKARAARGHSLKVASVASFFVSRLDALLDPKLAQEDQGKAAIALSHCAYGIWQRLFSGVEWQALAAQGARSQRLLWASTSTKNPNYSPTLYVDALIGPDTVNTMPLVTIKALLEAESVSSPLPAAVSSGRAVKAELEGKGVDFAESAKTLEIEAVDKFVQPFQKLLDSVEAKRAAVAG
mgnify:CR=1 FL=1